MRIVILANIVCAAILGVWEARYIYSFEVAFFGSLVVFYASYRAILRRMSALGKLSNGVNGGDSVDSNNANNPVPRNTTDSAKIAESKACEAHTNLNNSALSNGTDSPTPSDEITLKTREKFALGARISLGALRIAAYALLALGIVALINHKLFFIAPFFAGVIVSAFSVAFALKRRI